MIRLTILFALVWAGVMATLARLHREQERLQQQLDARNPTPSSRREAQR